MLNTPTENANGMISYPNFNGPFKARHHPDIAVLARLCEHAGVDLRLVVLQRGAADILSSVSVKRTFAPESTESAALADNAAVISMQLQRLDPRFFLCVDLVSLATGGLVFWQRFGGFLHPALREEASVSPIVQRLVQLAERKKANKQRKKMANITEPFDEGKLITKMDPWVEALQTGVAFINKTCAVASRQVDSAGRLVLLRERERERERESAPRGAWRARGF
jgi:hypothetical protein